MEKHSTKGPATRNGIHDLQKTPARQPVRSKVKPNPFETLQAIFRSLDTAAIHYTVARYRDDAVSIRATVPGERWEIDVLDDGSVDFERFIADGTILELAELKRSIERFAEPNN
jgi:hypothetical protein